MGERTVLELISEVDEFLSIHSKFEDSDLDMALSRIVNIIMKPDIPPSAATTLIVQLQAIASKLYIQANWYKSVDKPKPGTVEYEKKNMYFSIVTAIENLCQALKYSAKTL